MVYICADFIIQETMQELVSTFSQLDAWMQAYWICAIVGTAILAVQMILTMVGMDSSDVDVDFDGADTMDLGGSISLFSVRNFVNFVVGFGWAGVCLSESIRNRGLLCAVAVLVGVAFVLMFFFIKRQTKKLEHNGAFKIEDSVGKTVDVYLRIPAHREGKGKVQVSLHGTVHEFDAMTAGEGVASGKKVKVMDVIDGSTVLVEEC